MTQRQRQSDRERCSPGIEAMGVDEAIGDEPVDCLCRQRLKPAPRSAHERAAPRLHRAAQPGAPSARLIGQKPRPSPS